MSTEGIQGTSLSSHGPEIARILQRVRRAAEQVKTVRRAIDAHALEEGETLRGVRISLANRAYSRILGIVVFDVFAEDGTSLVEQLEIGGGFVEIREIPIHLFRECDFRIVAKEQDTLPDLINYLNVREKLLRGHIQVPGMAELDLFALFKARYPVIKEYLSGASTVPAVEPGLWEKIHRDFPGTWAERHHRMIPSYLVDQTIEEVHTGIGYDPRLEFPRDEIATSGGANGPSTSAEYWEILQRLGYLSRIERAQFGAKMYEKAEAADRKPFAYTVIYRPPDVGPIVYLCTNEPRHERSKRLRILMKCACAYLDASAVVGIATQSLSSEERSHDFCVMKDVSFADAQEAKRVAQQIFGEARGTSLDEWGNDYAPRA